MKASEIREKSIEEIQTLEGELRRKLWKAKFDNHTNQLDDTSDLRKLRRDIARVKTILTERTSAEASEK